MRVHVLDSIFVYFSLFFVVAACLCACVCACACVCVCFGSPRHRGPSISLISAVIVCVKGSHDTSHSILNQCRRLRTGGGYEGNQCKINACSTGANLQELGWNGAIRIKNSVFFTIFAITFFKSNFEKKFVVIWKLDVQ